MLQNVSTLPRLRRTVFGQRCVHSRRSIYARCMPKANVAQRSTLWTNRNIPHFGCGRADGTAGAARIMWASDTRVTIWRLGNAIKHSRIGSPGRIRTSDLTVKQPLKEPSRRYDFIALSVNQTPLPQGRCRFRHWAAIATERYRYLWRLPTKSPTRFGLPPSGAKTDGGRRQPAKPRSRLGATTAGQKVSETLPTKIRGDVALEERQRKS
jgi:hypothetical protein